MLLSGTGPPHEMRTLTPSMLRARSYVFLHHHNLYLPGNADETLYFQLFLGIANSKIQRVQLPNN